jgi:hypothetical protein
MMREAQQMMQDPAFQAQMKTMMATQGFKEKMSETNEAMKDPEKVAKMELDAKRSIVEGNLQIAQMEIARKEQAEKRALEAAGGKPAAKEDDVVLPVPNFN